MTAGVLIRKVLSGLYKAAVFAWSHLTKDTVVYTVVQIATNAVPCQNS